MSTQPRKLALDFIAPRIAPASRVLDVGSGDVRLGEYLPPSCRVWRTDRRELPGVIHADVTDPKWWAPQRDCFDAIVAMCSVQHMIGRECLVWSCIADALVKGGSFFYSGRYSRTAPLYEGDREDPLVGHNLTTLKTLAVGSGLEFQSFDIYRYDGEQSGRVSDDDSRANLILAHMVKL